MRRLSDQILPQCAAHLVEGLIAETTCFLRCEHGRTVRFERRDTCLTHGDIHDQVILARADQAVVEGFALDHQPCRSIHVGVGTDPGRRVARPYADRRSARAICRLDEATLAGGENQGDVVVAHELHRPGPAGRLSHPLHQVERRSLALQRLLNELAGLIADTDRVTVTAEDERIAFLERYQGFGHECRRGTGHGDETQDHPDRAGDLGSSLIRGTLQQPGPRLPRQRTVDAQASEAILDRLVRNVADPGLGHCGGRQMLGALGHTLGDVLEQRIYARLRPARKVLLRGDRTRDQRFYLRVCGQWRNRHGSLLHRFLSFLSALYVLSHRRGPITAHAHRLRISVYDIMSDTIPHTPTGGSHGTHCFFRLLVATPAQGARPDSGGACAASRLRCYHYSEDRGR